MAVPQGVGQHRWVQTPDPPIEVGAKQDVSCRRTAVSSILVGLCALLAGCGRDSEIVRLPVRGDVTLSGGEQFNGSITLIPASGQRGPAATTTVKDGNYQFDRTNGPTAGPHHVVIKRVISKSAMLESRGSRNPRAPKETPQGGEPRLEWTLSTDVTEQNLDHCDFKLEP
jgi:hypothetical protein